MVSVSVALYLLRLVGSRDVSYLHGVYPYRELDNLKNRKGPGNPGKGIPRTLVPRFSKGIPGILVPCFSSRKKTCTCYEIRQRGR